MRPTLISPNKRVSVSEGVEIRVLLTQLNNFPYKRLIFVLEIARPFLLIVDMKKLICLKCYPKIWRKLTHRRYKL